MNEILIHFVKQDKENNLCKYGIYYIIKICKNNAENSAKFSWVLHDSLLKKSNHNNLNSCFWKLLNMKNPKKTAIRYCNACLWIGKNLIKQPITSSKDIPKKLYLSTMISTMKVENEYKNCKCDFVLEIDGEIYNKETYDFL